MSENNIIYLSPTQLAHIKPHGKYNLNSRKCLVKNNYVNFDNLKVKVVTEKIVAFCPVTTGTPIIYSSD